MNYYNFIKDKDCHTRLLSEMNEVMLNNTPVTKEMICYYMYRNIALEKHKKYFEEKDFRYDITIIPPLLIDNEFNKTFGHYHPKGFGEVYEVLEGEAVFLLQNVYKKEVFAIYAKAKDVVLIPEGYGHITINNSMDKKLVMCNIVSNKFISLYPRLARIPPLLNEVKVGDELRNKSRLHLSFFCYNVEYI